MKVYISFTRVWLLFASLLLGMVFMVLPSATPDTPKYAMFIASETQLNIQNYVYFIFEHFSKITLIIFMLGVENKYRWAVLLFLFLEVGDLVDFLICYNEIWYSKNGLYVSYNIFKCVFFGAAISAHYVGRTTE